MPYIDAEQVKTIRLKIKELFPSKKGWKFSITKEHHSSVSVHILQAPILMTDSEDGRESVNQFYINEHYSNKPEIRDVLLKVYEITNEGNRIVSHDGDYGDIPKFYVTISIGDWNKPFKMSV